MRKVKLFLRRLLPAQEDDSLEGTRTSISEDGIDTPTCAYTLSQRLPSHGVSRTSTNGLPGPSHSPWRGSRSYVVEEKGEFFHPHRRRSPRGNPGHPSRPHSSADVPRRRPPTDCPSPGPSSDSVAADRPYVAEDVAQDDLPRVPHSQLSSIAPLRSVLQPSQVPLPSLPATTVTKVDFGQTVHPKRVIPVAPVGPVPEQEIALLKDTDSKFTIIQPLEKDVRRATELSLTQLDRADRSQRVTLGPGPLLCEEFNSRAAPAPAARARPALNHSMQTQTSYVAVAGIGTPCVGEDDARDRVTYRGSASSLESGVAGEVAESPPARSGGAGAAAARSPPPAVAPPLPPSTQEVIQLADNPTQGAVTPPSLSAASSVTSFTQPLRFPSRMLLGTASRSESRLNVGAGGNIRTVLHREPPVSISLEDLSVRLVRSAAEEPLGRTSSQGNMLTVPEAPPLPPRPHALSDTATASALLMQTQSHGGKHESNTRTVTEVMVHSQTCTMSCHGEQEPSRDQLGESCSKQKAAQFTVTKSVHDGREGVLLSPDAPIEKKVDVSPGASSEASPMAPQEGTEHQGPSEGNFMTVSLNCKFAQTVDVKVMPCVSWSHIPDGLSVTDSLGYPVAGARLEVIPYPCPCHPLKDIIRKKSSHRESLDEEALDDLKSSKSSSATSPECLPSCNNMSVQYVADVESKSESIRVTDDPATKEHLNESYDSETRTQLGCDSDTKTHLNESSRITSIGDQSTATDDSQPETRTDIISTRSLAAIGGQGMFRTVKEGHIQRHSVAVPVADTYISFVPVHVERALTTDSSEAPNAQIKQDRPTAHHEKHPALQSTEKCPMDTDKEPLTAQESLCTPTGYTNDTALDKREVGSKDVPQSESKPKREILTARRRSHSQQSSVTVRRSPVIAERSRILDTRTPTVAPPRESSICMFDLGDDEDSFVDKSSPTQEYYSTRDTETCQQLQEESHRVNLGEKESPEVDGFVARRHTTETQRDAVRESSARTSHSDTADESQASESANDAVAGEGSGQESRHRRMPDSTLLTRRPPSRRSRNQTRRSAKSTRDSTRRVRNTEGHSNKLAANRSTSATDNKVESLWISAWTKNPESSSKSFIDVSGEGSHLVFKCKDADPSALSFQLNLADIDENPLVMDSTWSKSPKQDDTLEPDACIDPESMENSYANEVQKHEANLYKAQQRHQDAGTAFPGRMMMRAKDAARSRAPFSFRSRRQPIAPLPEPNVATFECAICTDYLSPPVRQCVGGHGLCPGCLKAADHCKICGKNVPVSANKALDSLVRTILFPCKNCGAGCKESYWIEDRARHEAKCPYRPRPCPFATRSEVMCPWSGLRAMIRGHMKRAHGHHGIVYSYRTFFPLEDFNVAAWVGRTYHVEIVFVEHEIFELHKVFDKRNSCLWGLLRHILPRDANALFCYAIRFQPVNMRPNVTFRNDVVAGSDDLDKAFAQGKRFNLHLDCFTQTPLDTFSVQLKVQLRDRNKWP